MSDVETHSAVPYGTPADLPRPCFTIRGWDDGSVYVDVHCTCGRSLYDDDSPLTDDGTRQIECGKCKVVYSINVMCGVAET
jgi:hypothetical protein